MSIVDQLLAAAMGPPGGGRNDISSRFLRHFNVIAIEAFTSETMRNIFSVIMDWHFNKDFETQLKRYSRVSIYPNTTPFRECGTHNKNLLASLQLQILHFLTIILSIWSCYANISILIPMETINF